MNLSDLQKAHDYSALASNFGVSPVLLKAHLYGAASGYRRFQIAKKSGGVRNISSPLKLRRQLQEKLLPVLETTYRTNIYAHGFVVARSVRSNAQPHVGKRTILNIDLKDFFSSISFKRVRGAFLKPPFSLDWTVANILAQVCCDAGILPTGGITSPVLSNILMSRLDKRMASLVGRLGGDYSRYADDLTMSFDRPINQLSSILLVEGSGKLSIGGALSEIISSEGFAINEEKLRVAQGGARKIVTGLIVNEKVNVRRRWHSALESKVYAIEKFGWVKVASEEYPNEMGSGVAVRMLKRRIHGKISFLYMVRGRGDWLCADLAARFNRLHDSAQLRVPSVELISRPRRAPRGVVVIACYSTPTPNFSVPSHQGTGFIAASGLLVTAAHVLHDDDGGLLPYVYAMNERVKKLEICEVLAIDMHRDIAILRTESRNIDIERHRFRIKDAATLGSHVRSVAYPDYVFGNAASVQNHQVVKGFVSSLVHKWQVNGAIQGGASGGPLIDDEMDVVGLVHKGVLAPGGIPEMIDSSEIVSVAEGAGLSLY
jgi:retron-type reverse transcriptase